MSVSTLCPLTSAACCCLVSRDPGSPPALLLTQQRGSSPCHAVTLSRNMWRSEYLSSVGYYPPLLSQLRVEKGKYVVCVDMDSSRGRGVTTDHTAGVMSGQVSTRSTDWEWGGIGLPGPGSLVTTKLGARTKKQSLVQRALRPASDWVIWATAGLWLVASEVWRSHALEKFNERLIAVTRQRSERRYTSLLFKLCQEQINCSKFILSRRTGSHIAATLRYQNWSLASGWWLCGGLEPRSLQAKHWDCWWSLNQACCHPLLSYINLAQ